MENQWVEDWREGLGNYDFCLHGTTSTSRNLEVALDYSKCHKKYDNGKTPVLFVFNQSNIYGFTGFRMTDERYTPFPYEQEVLLEEGKSVKVIGVDDGLLIKNNIKTSNYKDEDIRRFNNKTVTVIYCDAWC